MTVFQNLPNDLIMRIIREAEDARRHKTALMPCLKQIKIAYDAIPAHAFYEGHSSDYIEPQGIPGFPVTPTDFGHGGYNHASNNKRLFNTLFGDRKLTMGSMEMIVRDMDEREEAQLQFDLNDDTKSTHPLGWQGWETPYGGDPWQYFHLDRLLPREEARTRLMELM